MRHFFSLHNHACEPVRQHWPPSSTMMKDEQDSCPLEIYEDSSRSDSHGASFDRSSYVVVRTDSDLHRQQRRCRTTSATNVSPPVQDRRRCGSVGEEQPELQIDETSSQADSGGSTIYTLFGDNNFLMVEPYMDGSEFLSSDNVFRAGSRSLPMNGATPQKRVQVKESHRVKRSSSHGSDAFSSLDLDSIEKLFHQLKTSSNATEKKQDKAVKGSERVRGSGGRAILSTKNDPKKDHGAENTTVRKKPHWDRDETRRKKAPRKHKKRTKEYTLPPVIPPPEIHVSDSVTVASSIGGLSQFLLPKCRLGPKQTTRITQDRRDRPTVHQHAAVAKPNSLPEMVDHDQHQTSSSRPAATTRNGSLPRPPTQQRTKSPKAKVPLESVFQSPREIHVSDPTIVSALTEYVQPIPNRRPQRRTCSLY
jgi:hypothetical protein